MGRFDGCLLACDIDGTLQESGYINPKNIEKIDYFVKEGGKFCLCTGRSIGAINCILRELNSVSYSVCANGCTIFNHAENKLEKQMTLNKKDYYVVREVFDRFSDFGIEIHAGREVLTVRKTFETSIHQEYEELPTNCVDFNTACEYNWNKVNFMLKSEEEYGEIIAFLNRFDVDANFVKTSAVIDSVKYNYYEMLPLGISKMSSLATLCNMLGVEKGKFFAIGDYYNDFEMIKNADIGAAVADAPEEIKQSADFVTCKCKDGAVADFIDYLIKVFK